MLACILTESTHFRTPGLYGLHLTNTTLLITSGSFSRLMVLIFYFCSYSARANSSQYPAYVLQEVNTIQSDENLKMSICRELMTEKEWWLSHQSCPRFHPPHEKQAVSVIIPSSYKDINRGQVCVRLTGIENFTTINWLKNIGSLARKLRTANNNVLFHKSLP